VEEPVSAHSPALGPDITMLAVVCPSWVGDCVMATPVLRALAQHRPEMKIVAITRPGLDEVLRGLPWLTEMRPCAFKGWSGPWQVASAIRSVKADAVLLLPNSFRSALAARLSGASKRIGYARDGRSWLLSKAVELPAKSQMPIAMIEYYAVLVESALGVKGIDRTPHLVCTSEQREQAAAVLHDVRDPFVVLNPGASKPAKRWPAQRFAEVADSLQRSHGVQVLVSGSPSERQIIDELCKAATRPIINLAERGLTLGSLKAVIDRAALLVTNDTGPRHFAAALGTPVVTLFGPTDHRWTTLNCPHERLVLAEPFLPEQLLADRNAQLCSIDKIPVSDVLVNCRALLDRRLIATRNDLNEVGQGSAA
jgi:heptosyltransferase-2